MSDPFVHIVDDDCSVRDSLALLLNFRGYDTLLEVGVLFVAALGVWSLGFIAPGPADTPSSPLLSALIRMLVPILVLTSGYLLRRGAYAPGGAFQAGALLGAAGVLILLSDVPVSSAWFSWPLKTALTAGFGVFLGVALYPVLLGGVLTILIIPGTREVFVMTTRALLNENPTPSLAEVKEALSGNLCRCGCYAAIAMAAGHAAEKIAARAVVQSTGLR